FLILLRCWCLQTRIERCRLLEFLLRLFWFSLLTQSQPQLKMCRRVIWRRVDRRPELRNGAVEIPGVKKPPPRICREERRLLARLLFRDIRSRFAFGRGTFGVSKLAEHGCQSRM